MKPAPISLNYGDLPTLLQQWPLTVFVRQSPNSTTRRGATISAGAYLLFAVTPGQSSVRNGVSGSPAPLKTFTTGLSAQP